MSEVKCTRLNSNANFFFRVALLDDVYKQIKLNNASDTFLDGEDTHSEPPFRRIDPALASNEHDEEVGVASGYAIQNPIPSGFVPPQNHANDIDLDNFQRYAVAGNKAGSYSIKKFTKIKNYLLKTPLKIGSRSKITKLTSLN